ncbi:14184_t:CDS:2, partial [Acaulospora morrowiae]
RKVARIKMFRYFQNKIWSPQTSPQLHPQNTPTNTDQDEGDIPYLAEVDQGGSVYRAMPLESYCQEEQPPKDVQFFLDGENKDRVVLVPGFLGYDTFDITLPFSGGTTWTIADYWSDVREVIDDPFVVSPSSFGSIHDRAVEIYYQIKGGRVDYGLRHSHQFGHKQHGATYEGLIPDWSPENPIVLIGKGYGATTALHLQNLLTTNFFGQHTSGKMIKGVICLSAPHRGSTLPYYLGL